MIGVLIIAHGNLGDSLIHCASHVMGKRPIQLEYLGVNNEDDPLILLPKAQQLVSQLNQGDGVLILSDMYGATPANLGAKLLIPNQVVGVSGINLPMLVRVLTYRNGDLCKLVEKAVSGGREGVVQYDQNSCQHFKDKV